MAKVGYYSSEKYAERACERFRATFPKRQFKAEQAGWTNPFKFVVAMYNDGVFVAHCAKFKAAPKPHVQRITCYDRGRSQIEIANTGGIIVTAARVQRSTRKERTDYWFRFNGVNYWGYIGHDGNAFSAKPVAKIPR